MGGPRQTWPAFYAWVLQTYWPSLAPPERIESRPGDNAEGVPDDIWQVALVCFPNVEAWLANPIPALDGDTALDTIEAGKADTVRRILQDVAAFMLPSADQMRPWRPDDA